MRTRNNINKTLMELEKEIASRKTLLAPFTNTSVLVYEKDGTLVLFKLDLVKNIFYFFAKITTSQNAAFETINNLNRSKCLGKFSLLDDKTLNYTGFLPVSDADTVSSILDKLEYSEKIIKLGADVINHPDREDEYITIINEVKEF